MTWSKKKAVLACFLKSGPHPDFRVNNFVAGPAKRLPVVHVVAEFWIVSEGPNAIPRSTDLTGECCGRAAPVPLAVPRHARTRAEAHGAVLTPSDLLPSIQRPGKDGIALLAAAIFDVALRLRALVCLPLLRRGHLAPHVLGHATRPSHRNYKLAMSWRN